MPRNRRLTTDLDFQEAMEQQIPIRVFQDDLMIGSGGLIIRITDSTIVTQSGVSELAYYEREACEFFEMERK